jgi:hypothetical protein
MNTNTRAAVVAFVVFVAVFFGVTAGARAITAHIRADQRATITREVDSIAATNGARERERLARALDSLRGELRGRDSAASVSAARARASIASLMRALDTITPTTRTETVTVAAAADVVRSCSIALDDCAAFRERATRALSVAESSRVADSASLARAAVTIAVKDDALRDVQRVATSRPGWRGVLLGTLAGLLTGALAVVGR